ncbi:MAG: DUF4344 domain-containing metallopeptidase [Deltaproteobacteria bacterium]|nr:DUF4344 domain-containing metallopeptidase [Deltaproteobacteria bacterium]
MRRTTLVLTTLLAITSCKKKDAETAAPLPTGSAAAGSGSGSADDKKQVDKIGHAKRPTGDAAVAIAGENKVLVGDVVPVKPEQKDRGHLKLIYKGADSETRKMLRSWGAFEQIIPQLDKALHLPRDVPITFEKCDEANAYYDPETVAITMCDELVDFYGELFSEYVGDEQKDAIVGSLVSVFLHELGHALIDQLQLPAVGKEEDAVDQLSTVVLIASGDTGNQMALDGAFSWIAEGETQGEDTTPFWDAHSLNEQRFYNMMCLIYGSSPDDYSEVITDKELPEERAEGCSDEYKLISTSWNKLLEPHLAVPTMRLQLKRVK